MLTQARRGFPCPESASQNGKAEFRSTNCWRRTPPVTIGWPTPNALRRRHRAGSDDRAEDVLAAALRTALSFDLERSVRAAVPIALAVALGAEIDPARLERVAQIIFAEIAMRYRVAAGAIRCSRFAAATPLRSASAAASCQRLLGRAGHPERPNGFVGLGFCDLQGPIAELRLGQVVHRHRPMP